MNIVAMIPARLGSNRFPNKLMQDLGGKTVILRTYQATYESGLFKEVYVVTDSDVIYNEIVSNGGKAVLSKTPHESGSDRIAEAVLSIEADIVVNVQGDEPFTNKKLLGDLLEVFDEDAEAKIDIASLMYEVTDKEKIENPNNVKVVVDDHDFAMYFSRSPIPYPRDENFAKYFIHVGIYAFRKEALLRFTKLPMTDLEKAEKLENLRFIAYGMSVKMVLTPFETIGIDSMLDLEKARKQL